MASTLKSVRERVQALESNGFPVVRQEATKAGHFKLWFTHEGTEYYVVVPSSPSDHRAIKRMLTDARNLASGAKSQRIKE